jgi:hypothetical protein
MAISPISGLWQLSRNLHTCSKANGFCQNIRKHFDSFGVSFLSQKLLNDLFSMAPTKERFLSVNTWCNGLLVTRFRVLLLDNRIHHSTSSKIILVNYFTPGILREIDPQHFIEIKKPSPYH